MESLVLMKNQNVLISRNKDKSFVYVEASGSIVIFLVLYVDNILLIGKNVPMLQSVKTWLGNLFRYEGLERLTYNWYKDL